MPGDLRPNEHVPQKKRPIFEALCLESFSPVPSFGLFGSPKTWYQVLEDLLSNSSYFPRGATVSKVFFLLLSFLLSLPGIFATKFPASGWTSKKKNGFPSTPSAREALRPHPRISPHWKQRRARGSSLGRTIRIVGLLRSHISWIR